MKKIYPLLLGLILFACSNDEETNPAVVVPPDNPVRNFQVFDHGNAGDGSDILISFNAAEENADLLEYRLYLWVKDESIVAADLIENTNFTRFDNDADQELQLENTTVDINGAAITSGNYQAVVLSIGSENNDLHGISSIREITLEDIPYYDVETLVTLPGVEALTYNKLTEAIYTPADNGVILEVDAHTGNYTTWIEDIDDGQGGFGGSFNRSYDKFYFSFWNSGRLGEYDIETSTWNILASNINGPTGTAVDQDGNVYVASYWSDIIYKVTPEGERTIFASGGALHSVDGLLFHNNTLYAINFVIPTIAKMTQEGVAELFTTLPQGGTRTGYMTFADGHFFAGSESRMYKIDLNGNAEIVFGDDQAILKDGPAPLARTSGLALGITANTAGDTVYFAEQRKIRMLIKRE